MSTLGLVPKGHQQKDISRIMRFTVLISDTEKHQDLLKTWTSSHFARPPQPVQDVFRLSGASTEPALAMSRSPKR